MQWVAIFLPAFIACAVQQKLMERKFTGSEMLQAWGIYTFLINLLAICVYQYILKTPYSWGENFTINTFVIHYMALSVILAVILSVLGQAAKPFVSIRAEKKEEQEEHTDEEV